MPHTPCYLMRKSVLTGLTRRYGSARCKICRVPIEVGEQVVSKSHGGRVGVKLYHKSCYDSLFLDI